jgi:hypothetical protein
MAEDKRKVGRPMGKLHQDDIRKKIQVSLLIKKLEDHALSSDDEAEISNSKMRAIQILLGKALPDLSSIQISGDDNQPLVIEQNVTVFGELLKSIRLQRQAE